MSIKSFLSSGVVFLSQSLRIPLNISLFVVTLSILTNLSPSISQEKISCCINPFWLLFITWYSSSCSRSLPTTEDCGIYVSIFFNTFLYSGVCITLLSKPGPSAFIIFFIFGLISSSQKTAAYTAKLPPFECPPKMKSSLYFFATSFK